jgi:hypothetical protein
MAGYHSSNEHGAQRGDYSKSGLISKHDNESQQSWFLGATIASIAGFVIFLNSLNGDLIFDDVHAIIRNRFDGVIFHLSDWC